MDSNDRPQFGAGNPFLGVTMKCAVDGTTADFYGPEEDAGRANAAAHGWELNPDVCPECAAKPKKKSVK